MDCSLPGSSIRGISQARMLEWIAISFSRGSSLPSNRSWVFCIGRQVLYGLSLQGQCSIFVTTLFQQMAVKPQGKVSTLSIYSFNLAALTLLPHTGFPQLWSLGLSLQWHLLLQSTGLGVGFSNCVLWAQLPRGIWNLPGPGLEPIQEDS